jgi:Bacterial Ig-like domain (group 3)
VTPAQVRGDLIASVQPMNGTRAGTWNSQSGFGLINTVAVLGILEPPAGSATRTTVMSSAPAAAFGQTLTLTATINAIAALPTGFVEFFDATRDVELGAVTLSDGVATIDGVPSLGNTLIVATYSGNLQFSPSSAGATATVLDSILVLDPSADGALYVPGSSRISMPGPVIVDSSANDALTASGSG